MKTLILDRLNTFVNDYISEGIGPGINLAYFENGHWTTVSAGTMDDRNIPTSQDIYYDIASLTKTVISTYILTKINHGMSQFNNLWLYFGFQEKTLGKITIYDLLTHRSGLKCNYDFKEIFSKSDEEIAKLNIDQIFFDEHSYNQKNFRIKTQYTCVNYVLLGKIIEKYQNLKLEDIIHDFFVSNSIKGIIYKPIENGISPKNIAKSENKLINGNKAPIGVVQDEIARNFGGVCGNAGLFATLNGLQSFVEFWLKLDSNFTEKVLGDILLTEVAKNPMDYSSDPKSLCGGKPINIDDIQTTVFGHVWRRGAFSLYPNMNGWSGPAIIIDFENKRAVVQTSNHTFPIRDEIRRKLNKEWNINLNLFFENY
jgi:CubicO group peptidase (beta-lactamase class C family)